MLKITHIASYCTEDEGLKRLCPPLY